MDNSSTNNLPIVQGLWIGGALSVMEQLCIASFLKNGHVFHLYTYEEVSNIPEGTVVLDANDILSKDKIFTYKNNGSYAGFANYFRYKLLFEKGNIWTDMDMICLQPLANLAEYSFAAQNQRISGSKLKVLIKKCLSPFLPLKKRIAYGIHSVNCCFMKCPANSEIMKYCYDVAANADPKTLTWGKTGPRLLTQAIEHFNVYHLVEDIETYCAVAPWNWQDFIKANKNINQTFKNAKAVHLWNEFWRREGVDKSQAFDQNSIYEIWKQKYLS